MLNLMRLSRDHYFLAVFFAESFDMHMAVGEPFAISDFGFEVNRHFSPRIEVLCHIIFRGRAVMALYQVAAYSIPLRRI